jgi:nucleotide-binding universal stress UspA family protein
MFDKILLAVDGSDHAKRAARVAADLARAHKAGELRIVVAYDPARTRDAEAILEGTRAGLGKVPADLQSEILEGPVAEAILKVARTRKSDIIVMGSRGLGRLEGALLGSNSQKVVSHAPCPVLVVR